MNPKGVLNIASQEIRGGFIYILHEYERVNTVHSSRSNKEVFLQYTNLALALLFFGGGYQHLFFYSLIIGMIVSTYSSIYLSGPGAIQTGLTAATPSNLK